MTFQEVGAEKEKFKHNYFTVLFGYYTLQMCIVFTWGQSIMLITLGTM